MHRVDTSTQNGSSIYLYPHIQVPKWHEGGFTASLKAASFATSFHCRQLLEAVGAFSDIQTYNLWATLMVNMFKELKKLSDKNHGSCVMGSPAYSTCHGLPGPHLRTAHLPQMPGTCQLNQFRQVKPSTFPSPLCNMWSISWSYDSCWGFLSFEFNSGPRRKRWLFVSPISGKLKWL
jgi:hypothetical protein